MIADANDEAQFAELYTQERADPARLETTRASNERRAGPHPDAPDQEEHGETTRLEIGLEQS